MFACNGDDTMNQFSKITAALTLISLGVALPAGAATVLYNNDFLS
jgi:hypothetical protein